MSRRKRHGVMGLSILWLLAALAWPQTTELELNSRTARQELEVMKGILRTTLEFSVQAEEQEEASLGEPFVVPGWGSSVEGFYLYGQGAVFVVSVPGPRLHGELQMLEYELQAVETERLMSEEMIKRMQRTAERAARQARDQAREAARAGREAPTAPQPAEPALPPAAPVPPAPPKVSEEEMQAKLAELQQKMEQRKEESERRQAEYEELLAKTGESLLQALAKHGDALTTVKQGEYINLILSSGGFGPEFAVRRGETGKARVLSVPRSAISDYKAGRLDLAGFKAKVVSYQL